MKMLTNEHFEWYWNEATPEEQKLNNRVDGFEEFFYDMTFHPGSCSYELIECVSTAVGSDEWVEDEAVLPDQLSFFTYEYFKFKVADLIPGAAGFFDPDEQLLCIGPEYVDNDIVILHEMIHLHEFVINDLPMYFHDMVYWAIYQKLRKQIPGLDEIISCHAHLLTGNDMYTRGGTHDILFLLKSFDLDIRNGYPLGTVFGYGRDDDFKKYTYIADTDSNDR